MDDSSTSRTYTLRAGVALMLAGVGLTAFVIQAYTVQTRIFHADIAARADAAQGRRGASPYEFEATDTWTPNAPLSLAADDTTLAAPVASSP